MVADRSTLAEALNDLADREINHGLSYFFDDGWTVWIGDDLNGVFAAKEFQNLDEVPTWLIEKAAQWERRSGLRLVAPKNEDPDDSA
jgi:hypothetical protein